MRPRFMDGGAETCILIMTEEGFRADAITFGWLELSI